jgi:hypothetical protein
MRRGAEPTVVAAVSAADLATVQAARLPLQR